MAAKPKYSLDIKLAAVERYKLGESVKDLAKELDVSLPAIYLWIKASSEPPRETNREPNREGFAREALTRPVAVTRSAEDIHAKVKRLEDESVRLKARLYDLLNS